MEISIGRPWYNDCGSERLTNIRYADDLMLFAKSLTIEMIQMVQMSEEELAAAGLHLNISKTKLLTTDSNEPVPQHVEIGNAWVEVLTDGDTHKYLGRKLSGDVTQRSAVDFAARIQAAWGRFHQHQTVLLNKDVSIALRLKMFDAVVTPTEIRFGDHATYTTAVVRVGQHTEAYVEINHWLASQQCRRLACQHAANE